MKLFHVCECGHSETVYIAGAYGVVNCEDCGTVTEVDVDALLELESQDVAPESQQTQLTY